MNTAFCPPNSTINSSISCILYLPATNIPESSSHKEAHFSRIEMLWISMLIRVGLSPVVCFLHLCFALLISSIGSEGPKVCQKVRTSPASQCARTDDAR